MSLEIDKNSFWDNLEEDVSPVANQETGPWYMRHSYVSYLQDIGDEIIKRHQDDKIYTLGQSLTWPFKINKILDPNIIEAINIPFSGKFYHHLGHLYQKEKVFQKNEAQTPNEMQVTHYREVLNQIGLKS